MYTFQFQQFSQVSQYQHPGFSRSTPIQPQQAQPAARSYQAPSFYQGLMGVYGQLGQSWSSYLGGQQTYAPQSHQNGNNGFQYQTSIRNHGNFGRSHFGSFSP